jgi:hypothetical protein
MTVRGSAAGATLGRFEPLTNQASTCVRLLPAKRRQAALPKEGAADKVWGSRWSWQSIARLGGNFG